MTTETTTAAGQQSPQARLLTEVVAVRVRWPGFQRTRRVPPREKERMAQAVGADVRGFASTKRLMSSRHPIVAEANALLARVRKYIELHTLPVVQFGASADADLQRKEGGVYLVKLDEAEAFYAAIERFRHELAEMSDKLNRNLEAIKEFDRQLLGDRLFDPADYPEAINLTLICRPVNLDIPSKLRQYAPRMFERELEAARQEAQAICRGAAAAMLDSIREVLESMMQAMTSDVVKLHPVGEKYRELDGAEVLLVYTHKIDPDVPEGQVRVKIKRREGTKQVVELVDMPERDYQEMCEIDTSARRVFKQTTVQNTLEILDKFQRMSGLLGLSPALTSAMDMTRMRLEALGRNAEDISNALRESDTLRSQAAQIVRQALETVADETAVLRRNKRKIDRAAAVEGGE